MSDRRLLAQRILSLIDLTNLNDGCTPEEIKTLCARASGQWGHTAAVCVWPRFVGLSKSLLIDSPIQVATVVNFPSGDGEVAATIKETVDALNAGADEIDLVLPYAALQRGDESTVIAMLSAICNVVPEPSLLKVILETGELVDPILIERATHLAIAAGADFIKTSTGKTRTSATPQAVTIMLATIRASGRAVGLKPSGGIRTVDDARGYLQLADAVMGQDWATPQTFRFGASGLLDAVESELA